MGEEKKMNMKQFKEITNKTLIKIILLFWNYYCGGLLNKELFVNAVFFIF